MRFPQRIKRGWTPVCVFGLLLLTAGFECRSPAGNDGADNGIDYRQAMRDFIGAISETARQSHSGFIIIPQNGQVLLTLNGEPDGEPAADYLSAIDGTGREDLWYGYEADDTPAPAEERDFMLGFLNRAEAENSQALVIDYCATSVHVDDSYAQNSSRGFVSFAADSRELDRIPQYPEAPFGVNSSDCDNLEAAANFLYLINPDRYESKLEFLNTLKNTDFDVLVIDLFFNDGSSLTGDDVFSLKMKAGGGRRLVIAYLSIGEAETYRYYWQDQWESEPPDWLTDENPDWPGNYKVRYWDPGWQAIILNGAEAYLLKICNAGFDGVYLDIVDAFEYFETL